MTERSRRTAPKPIRRLAVLGIAGLVVVAGAGTAYATVSSRSAPAYRLASATPARVIATLDVVGTLNPVQLADVPFTVSGTVGSVAVKEGQRVSPGQKLGSLSKASLKAELTAAQSALAGANLQVSNDLASQDQAGSGSAAGAGAGAGSAAGAGAGSSRGTGSSSKATTSSLRPLQQGVLRGQQRADHALARAKMALAHASRACAGSPGPGPGATPSPSPSTTQTVSSAGRVARSVTGPAARSPSPGTTPAGSAGPSPSPVPTSSSPAPTSSSQGPCARATKRVLAAETVVLHAQQELSGQLTALSTALAKLIAAAGASPAHSGDDGATSGAGSSGAGSGSSGAGSGSSGAGSGPARTGGASGLVSAAQLAADQATADADATQLTVAQQDLANATVLSPIGGTIVAVDVSPGTAVSAGSAAFEVAGLDSYQVVTEVPVTDLPALKVGQRASVQPDGLNRPLMGSVDSIGLTPDTSASPVTYPVTIGITGQAAGALHPNGFADVTITTGQSRGVSVPTSAVHYSGHSATVAVYSGGKTHSVKVRVGTRGPVMTRITAGLKAGQQVALASLRKPLPTNNPPGQIGPGAGGGAVLQP